MNMADDKNVEFFMKHMPLLKNNKKIIILYSAQFLFFIFLFFIFWWFTSKIFYYAIIIETIVIIIGTTPYRYLTLKSEAIRKKYLEKYASLAAQQLWLKFESYTIPSMSSSLYFPIILKTDYFLPELVDYPSHILTNTLFPVYVALPLSIFIIFIGFKIRRPSGGFGPDVESYFYLLYPGKGTLLHKGTYRYVRNPSYLGRGLMAIGLGFFANNLLGIIVGLIHFIGFSSLIPSEGKELNRRFGTDYEIYKKNTPALIPKFGTWRPFLKEAFKRKK